MPSLRQDLQDWAAEAIEQEAAKDQNELGLGVSIAYVFANNGSIKAYRITANTNLEDGTVGVSLTFPDLAINRAPTEAEITAISTEYGLEFIVAIKARRAELSP